MAMTLALVELCSFVAACSLVLLWVRPEIAQGALTGLVAPTASLWLSFLIAFYYNGLYDLRLVRSLAQFVRRFTQSLLVAFVLISVFYLLLPEVPLGVASFALVVLTTAVFLLIVRAACYPLLQSGLFSERVLILGEGPLARRIAAGIDEARDLRYSLLGLVGESGAGGPGGDRAGLVGSLDQLEAILAKLKPDRVVVALSQREAELPTESLLYCRLQGLRVEDGVEFHETVAQKLAIERLEPRQLLFSKPLQKSRVQLALRRVVSLTVAALGLVVGAPLMALIALWIKITSPGPLFFIQDRAGRRGRVFRLIKFRTMHQAPPEERASVWERDLSSRVTPAGKWLRKSRLDELPQFINVLKGDMDLVGPRPEMASNIEEMTAQIPYYSLRMLVRPGITGWAQIQLGYSVSPSQVQEKLRYDLYYIKHMSLWFDLRILVDTVKTVLLGRGAQ